jgi:hypothetical protein
MTEEICANCNGTGIETEHTSTDLGMKIDEYPCEECNGTGFVPQKEDNHSPVNPEGDADDTSQDRVQIHSASSLSVDSLNSRQSKANKESETKSHTIPAESSPTGEIKEQEKCGDTPLQQHCHKITSEEQKVSKKRNMDTAPLVFQTLSDKISIFEFVDCVKWDGKNIIDTFDGQEDNSDWKHPAILLEDVKEAVKKIFDAQEYDTCQDCFVVDVEKIKIIIGEKLIK